jgi:hypothetical protein
MNKPTTQHQDAEDGVHSDCCVPQGEEPFEGESDEARS